MHWLRVRSRLPARIDAIVPRRLTLLPPPDRPLPPPDRPRSSRMNPEDTSSSEDELMMPTTVKRAVGSEMVRASQWSAFS